MLISLIAWYWLAYGVARSNFIEVLGIFSILFLAYFFIIKAADHGKVIGWGLFGAIVFRLLYLPAMPELSDDIFRFIWDGRLLAQGIDPFKHLPTYYIEGDGQSLGLTGINEALFSKLNSPEYYSVYPPLSQGIFTLAAWLFPKSTLGITIVIRAVVLAFDLANIYLLSWLLRYWKLPRYLTLLYALNPLVIAELTGNLHFEGIMIFGLLLAVVLLCQNRLYFSAGAFAIGVLAKLLPLIFLPLLIRRIGFWQTCLYGLIVGILTLLGFIAISSLGQLYNMFQSVELYFQTFEFNASVYYVFRWIGFQVEGYNMISIIGKILPLLTILGVGFYTWREQKTDLRHFPQAMVIVLTLYLVLSTTVHPWYITTLLPFSLLTRYRFPFLWSFLGVLSYSAYWHQAYEEVYWLIAIEYGLVFTMLILEWFKPGFFKSGYFKLYANS